MSVPKQVIAQLGLALAEGDLANTLAESLVSEFFGKSMENETFFAGDDAEGIDVALIFAPRTGDTQTTAFKIVLSIEPITTADMETYKRRAGIVDDETFDAAIKSQDGLLPRAGESADEFTSVPVSRVLH